MRDRRWWVPTTYDRPREQEREYRRSAEWSTTAVGLLKLTAGRDWSPDDYDDLIPGLPDTTTHATRQASWYAYYHWKTGDLQLQRVGDMTLDDIEHAEMKFARMHNAYERAWYNAFTQEINYRAQVHAYEAQTQGRYDGSG